MSHLPDPLESRQPDHEILPLFLKRWSPRAMTGEPLTEGELNQLLEAARWAPSTYNEQEWRFLYGRRDTDHWPVYMNLLMEANQVWCKDAGVLVVIASHKVFARNGKPNPVHTFDSGAAFENMVLQAAEMGLVAHGMAGFDRQKARRDLQIPDDYEVEAMVALGRPGDPASLPEELREREHPTGRKPIAEISCEGRFSL
ncbi:MAG: nitroreductase family protein [Planctomycetaceae bacterium]|nr:nitroreductase family protein [Planctomycetaceae bacterium]